MIKFLNFRRPELAIAAAVAFVFVVASTLLPGAADKFGFLIATGAGIYFLVTSGKALNGDQPNLGLVLFIAAFAMIFCAIIFTNADTLKASALEDIVPSIIGGLGGVFTKVDDNE